MDPILLKTLAAVVLGFAISAILGKFLVPALRRWKAGQSIKEDGPTWHMSKQGTPTMGGSCLFWHPGRHCPHRLAGYCQGDFRAGFVLCFASGVRCHRLSG